MGIAEDVMRKKGESKDQHLGENEGELFAVQFSPYFVSVSTQFKTRQQVFDEYPQEFYQLMVQNNLSEGDEQ